MNGYTVAGEILESIESQHDGDHSQRKQAMIERLQDQMAADRETSKSQSSLGA